MGSNSLLADTQILMDQLRQKAPTFRSWDDLIKIAKTNFMEKRNPLDAEDRTQIQQALEILRKTVSVTSNKELMEILENISNRLGLKFTLSPPGNFNGCYITHESADCFAISIRCSANPPGGTTGTAATAGNANCGKVDSCDLIYCDKSQTPFHELTRIVNCRKWDELEELLRRLMSILCFSNDRNINLDVFTHLKRLESHFESISNDFLANNSLFDCILRSPCGLLVPRSAGSLARLHFFLPPEDMVDTKEENFWNPTFNEFVGNKKGYWADIGAENCNIMQNLNANGSQSTKALPANYFLEFSEPLIVSADTMNRLNELTGFPATVNQSGNAILLALRKKFPDTGISGNDIAPLFVILPDQRHKYVINSTSNFRLDSHVITKIRFTNPNVLPQIFAMIRSDSAYTSTFYSCFRIYGDETSGRVYRTNGKNCFQFELSSPYYSKVECLFEHPYVESGFISVKFVTNESFKTAIAEVSFINVDTDQPENLSNVATTVFQRFLSIPVTVRAVIKRLSKNRLDADDNNDSSDNHGPNDKRFRKNDYDNDGSGSDDSSQYDDDDTNGGYDGDGDEFMDCDYTHKSKDRKQHGGLAGYKSSTVYSGQQIINVRNLRLVPKRYDQQKALDFAMHFDEMALSRNLPNMLDLFKEVDEWEELIPPRTNQKPPPSLRSPAHQQPPQPFGKQRLVQMQMYGGGGVGVMGVPPPISLPPQMMIHQSAAPPPPPIQLQKPPTPAQYQYQQPPTPIQIGTMAGRSPKVRHVSQTSDTFGDLEQLSALSRQFQTDNNTVIGGGCGPLSASSLGGGSGQQYQLASGHSSIGGGSESDSVSSSCVTTPVSDRPAPLLERKSSLQDTIDSVVMGAAAQASSGQMQHMSAMSSPGHVMQTSFSSMPSSSSNISAPSTACRQQQQQQLQPQHQQVGLQLQQSGPQHQQQQSGPQQQQQHHGGPQLQHPGPLHQHQAAAGPQHQQHVVAQHQQQQQQHQAQSIFMHQRSMSVSGASTGSNVDFGQVDFMSMGPSMSHQSQGMMSVGGSGGGGGGSSSVVSGSPRGSVSSMDVFDFDKSEAFDNSAMIQRWSNTQYSGEPDIQAAMMGYNPDGSMQNMPHQSLYQMRGMITSRGNNVRRRRTRRTMANVGDRNYDMVLKEMKEMKKAEKAAQRGAKAPRRPRRARGSGSSQSSTPPHIVDNNGNKIRNKFYQDSGEEDDHSGSKMFSDQYQPQPQQQQQNVAMNQSQTPPASSLSYGGGGNFPSSSNIMALKDMMSNYGTGSSGAFKDFFPSGNTQSSQGLEMETFDEQQHYLQQHQHMHHHQHSHSSQSNSSVTQAPPASVMGGPQTYKATDDNLRRQIHAVVQETIYNENPAFQQHLSNQSVTSNDDVFAIGGGGGGTNVTTNNSAAAAACQPMASSFMGGGASTGHHQTFRPPSRTVEQHQQQSVVSSESAHMDFLAQNLPPRSGSLGNNQQSTMAAMMDPHASNTSLPNSSAGGNLFDNLSKLKQQTSSTSAITAALTTSSNSTNSGGGNFMSGLTMSAAFKRKGSLNDVIGKLTAGVFRSHGSVGSSEESDETGPNFEMDDYSGVAASGVQAGPVVAATTTRPSSSTSSSSFPPAKRVKVASHRELTDESSSQMDFGRQPAMFDKKDFGAELSVTTAIPSSAMVRNTETVSAVSSVSSAGQPMVTASTTIWSSKESGGVSTNQNQSHPQMGTGQPLKLVIKRKDLKLVSTTSTNNNNNDPSASTIAHARAILSSKLARSAEIVTKSVHQSQHAATGGAAAAANNKRMTSPLTMEALKHSSATVQQLMQRQAQSFMTQAEGPDSRTPQPQKYNVEYRQQRPQEKKAKKGGAVASSAIQSGMPPGGVATPTTFVNFGTGFAKIQNQQQQLQQQQQQQQQIQPGGPAETAKLTAKLLEKGTTSGGGTAGGQQKMPARVQETERKSFSQAVPHTVANPAGKTPNTAPVSSDTSSQQSIPVFPGTEGILFSKSLTGYKIPKIDEKCQQPPSIGGTGFTSLFGVASSATSAPAAVVPHLSASAPNISAQSASPQRKPPFQPSHPSSAAKMPKSILKYNRNESQASSSATIPPLMGSILPQPLQQQKMSGTSSAANADFAKRRPLLPDPTKYSAAEAVAANAFGSSNFFKSSFDDFESQLQFQAHPKPLGSQTTSGGASGSTPSSSSANDPMLADDTDKSPTNLHNSSKDSDNSPGLRIDIDSAVSEDFSSNRGPPSPENF